MLPMLCLCMAQDTNGVFYAEQFQNVVILLQPIEDLIHQKFIPAITGRPPCSLDDRALLALPMKLGGLGLVDPNSSAASRKITSTLIQSIINQEIKFQDDPTLPNADISKIKQAKVERQKNKFTSIYCGLEQPPRGDLWIVQVNSVPPPGSLPCLLKSRVFAFQRVLSEMLSAFVMDGSFLV